MAMPRSLVADVTEEANLLKWQIVRHTYFTVEGIIWPDLQKDVTCLTAVPNSIPSLCAHMTLSQREWGTGNEVWAW